jgi:hypothetical protein
MNVTALALAVAAVGQTAPPAPRHGEPPCPTCGYACALGTVNCWACGTRIADLRSPAGFARVEHLSLLGRLRQRFPAGEDLTPLTLVVEGLRRWFGDHPADFDEAAARIEAVAPRAKGTDEEAALGALLAEVTRRRELAERPESPDERQKVVAREVDRVMVEVARSPGATAVNVARLEKLLEAAAGTIYERLVRDHIAAERAKLPR